MVLGPRGPGRVGRCQEFFLSYTVILPVSVRVQSLHDIQDVSERVGEQKEN